MFIHIFLLFVISIHSSWGLNIQNAHSRKHGENNNDMTPAEGPEKKISFIYPGTKWCGTGNDAEDYDDLGTEKEADMCCRDHDNCPDLIEAGDTKYNLTNNGYYTRLSCECDLTFRKCLQDAQTQTAQQVGNVYFNVLGTQCFKEDYPIIGCNKRSGWLNHRCDDYELDESGEKQNQWFDVPAFNTTETDATII